MNVGESLYGVDFGSKNGRTNTLRNENVPVESAVN